MRAGEWGVMDTCGILHDGGVIGPEDPHGCLLPHDHDGPHEFEASDGTRWHWETDIECTCEHCMRCDGDYCTVYWQKARHETSSPSQDSIPF